MKRRLASALALALAAMLCGCTAAGDAKAGITITRGSMLHLQQVLERYDAGGNAVLQYLELWLTPDGSRCSELDAGGNELVVALDEGKSHIRYDAASLAAEKLDRSAVFIVSAAAIKKAYPKVRESGEGEYAGCACSFYLLDTGDEDEWAKLYVDKKTGYVLLCDTETFRLRTALLEERPLDNTLFAEPAGLVYEGGNGE